MCHFLFYASIYQFLNVDGISLSIITFILTFTSIPIFFMYMYDRYIKYVNVSFPIMPSDTASFTTILTFLYISHVSLFHLLIGSLVEIVALILSFFFTLLIFHGFEFVVLLVVGIHKMLYFCHCKLSHS